MIRHRRRIFIFSTTKNLFTGRRAVGKPLAADGVFISLDGQKKIEKYFFMLILDLACKCAKQQLLYSFKFVLYIIRIKSEYP